MSNEIMAIEVKRLTSNLADGKVSVRMEARRKIQIHSILSVITITYFLSSLRVVGTLLRSIGFYC
jgi:hypothetical protein